MLVSARPSSDVGKVFCVGGGSGECARRRTESDDVTLFSDGDLCGWIFHANTSPQQQEAQDLTMVKIVAPSVHRSHRQRISMSVWSLPRLLWFALPLHVMALAAADNHKTFKPLRLQAPHPDLTPSEHLHELAFICKVNGIESWDVYGDFLGTPNSDGSSFLRSFEAEMAAEFGKEDAVFMPSGVMAQSIALLIHYSNQQKQKQQSSSLHKTKTFACHPTSHLLLHEQDGFEELCGFSARVVPATTKDVTGLGLGAPPLLWEHLQTMSLEKVSTLILELPHRELGGKLTPWEDIMKMKQLLAKQGVAFHCDGARIFEASAGYDKSLAELAEPFDSVYISFYKGLGGMSGAMLMGSADFCQPARVWLRRFGGNLFTLMPYIVSAWAGYQRHWKLNNTILGAGASSLAVMSFSEKRDKLVRIVEALTHMDDGESTAFSKIACFEPKSPEVSMVHLYLRPTCEECMRIRDRVQEEHGISVFHRLRTLEEGCTAFQEGYRSMMEISAGQANGEIPDDRWVAAWNDFAQQALESTGEIF